MNDKGEYSTRDDDWAVWVVDGRQLFEETRAALAAIADVVWNQGD